MASDVLGPNSAFTSSKELNFVDHLLESQILDVEPQYENSEIIRKILQKNNSFSKSLMAIHEEVLNSKVKEENIYENVGFLENSINSIAEKKQSDSYQPNDETNSSISHHDVKHLRIKEDVKNDEEETFTSTLSFTIGNPVSVEVKEHTLKKELKVDVQSPPDGQEFDDSDDGSYKSSYAKSLIDSFKKISPQTSPIGESPTRLSSPTTMHEDIKPHVSFMQAIEKECSSMQNSPKIYLSKSQSSLSTKSVESLEKRISSLTDNVLMKDKELEKLRQEIMFLKSECNRVKCENRSLKVNGLSGKSCSFLPNGDSLPHSFSSLSTESDVWTLQQQIISLNSQLEKAELSRHAYEAATKQLVHFLQTINTTLTTVAGPDAKMESPFTPQNTSELLTNLELSLLHNRVRSTMTPSPKVKINPYADSREGSFVVNKPDPFSSSEIDRRLRHKHDLRNSLLKENKYPSGTSAPNSITSVTSLDSGHRSSLSDTKETFEKGISSKESGSSRESPKISETKESKSKRSPQRRFSISQKLLNSTKKPTIIRSGSVSNLPTDFSPIPRVSRAVSSHCVAVGKIETLPPGIHGEAVTPSGTNPNKLRSSKAKDFFSSLKNIFKTDGDRSPTSETPSNTKKKLTLPTIHRSSKVKTDLPPLSLPSNASTSQTNLKKRHSMKTQPIARDSAPEDKERVPHNSIFYVPCFTQDGELDDVVDANEVMIDCEDKPSLSSESAGDGKNSPSTSSVTQVPVVPEEELSGPQELSVGLSLENHVPAKETSLKIEGNTSPPSGALLTITGGGSSLKRACLRDKSSTECGDGICLTCVQRFSTVNNEEKVTEDVLNSLRDLPSGSKKGVFLGGNDCGHAKSTSLDRHDSKVLRHRYSDFDAIGLKCSLWKLSRESFRSKGCRVVFV